MNQMEIWPEADNWAEPVCRESEAKFKPDWSSEMSSSVVTWLNQLSYRNTTAGIEFVQFFEQPGTKAGVSCMQTTVLYKHVQKNSGIHASSNGVRGCQGHSIECFLWIWLNGLRNYRKMDTHKLFSTDNDKLRDCVSLDGFAGQNVKVGELLGDFDSAGLRVVLLWL